MKKKKLHSAQSDSSRSDPVVSLLNHDARITCIRMFPFYETSLFRCAKETRSDVLVTSSCDHPIRLWWKGRCQCCYRGHSGPAFITPQGKSNDAELSSQAKSLRNLKHTHSRSSSTGNMTMI